MTTILDRIKNKAQQAWTGVTGAVSNAANTVGNVVNNALDYQSPNMKTSLRGAFNQVNPTIGTDFSNLISGQGTFAQKIPGLNTGLNFIGSKIAKPIGDIPQNIGNVFDPNKSAFDKILSSLQVGAALVPGVDDAVVAGLQTAQEKLTGGNQNVLTPNYNPTPLGDTLRNRGINGAGATALDVAELPLLIGTVLATGKGGDALIKRGSDLLPAAKNAGNVVEQLAKNDGVSTLAKQADNLLPNPAQTDVIEKTVKATPLQDTNNLFKKWVNTRDNLTNWKANEIKRNADLTAFDKEGLNAINELQSGVNPEKYKNVKNFTDQLYEMEQKAGLGSDYKKNYLPQLWKNDPAEVQQVFSKTYGKDPGFTKTRLFEDYKAGIEAGLTPKYETISDLLQARFKTAQKSLADREFINSLADSGNAYTTGAPKGFQSIPSLSKKGKTLSVPADLAKKITTYTSEPSSFLEKIAQAVSESKQTLLSAGFPKTGWNYHTGVNIPVRAAIARKNPFGSLVDSVVWNTNPKAAEDYIDSVPKELTEGFIINGLTLFRSSNASDYGFKPEAGKGVIKKIRGDFDKLFSEAAFDKILPAQKLKLAVEVYEKMIKKGSSAEEAMQIAAHTSNDVFSGINTAELARNKDFQNVLRSILLAPDWLESNLRLAGKTLKSVTTGIGDKNLSPYRSITAKALAAYTAFAITNKATSGHYPWENGAGNEFKLATGSYDDRGRERMISVFGTGFDFVRIPYTLISSVKNNDPQAALNIVKNRLSPQLGAGLSLLSNKDYKGREVYSKDKTPFENIAGIGGQLGTAAGIPSQVTNTGALLSGSSTGEEWFANMLEAPLNYRGGANTASKIKQAENLKKAGLSNEEIGSALNKKTAVQGGGLLNGLFGSKEIEVPTGKLSREEKKAYKESITKALDAGSIPNKEALAVAFFDNKVATSKSLEERTEVYQNLSSIMKDEFYTDEQKQAAIQAAGASKEDIEYYLLASKDQDIRLEELLPKLEGMSYEDSLSFLMKGRRAIAGKQLISNAMITYLYENDYIDKNAKNALTNLKFDEINGKFYYPKSYLKKSSGSGSSSGSTKKAKKRALPSFSSLGDINDLLNIYKGVSAQTGSANDKLISNILAAPKRAKSNDSWF